MALPSAILKQRRELQASLGLDENGQPLPVTTLTDPPVVEATTPTAVPPATPAPELTPAPIPAPAAPTDARIKELEHLLSTRDGQTSTAMRKQNEAETRADALALQVKTLEDSVAELIKQKDTAVALGTARQTELPSLDDVPEPTAEEIEKFGGDSIAFISKMSKKEILAYLKPLFEKQKAMETALSRLSDLDKLPAIERTVQASAAESQRMKEEDFFRKEVLAFFPDFEKVRDVPEWKDYLSTDIPGKGIKIGNLLNQYRMQHDAPGIRSILESYYAKNKGKQNLSDLAVPSKTQTNGEPPTKPKFKASEYKAKLRAFTSRQLPKAEWDAYKADFSTALTEGRVDMDERL